MFESSAGSFSIHPSGFVSYNCKNESLSHQLKCLVFADATVPWLSLCITRISHSCSIFKRRGMKNVTKKKKAHLRCGTLRSRQFILANLPRVGASPPQAALQSWTAGRFYSSPTQPHNCDPISPPTLSYRGYKYHAGPRLNLQEAALTQRGGQGASGWKLRGIFYVRETTERRAEGRHRSLTGSCGVLDWKHSLILPAAPGHSCFKCSRTKQTKMVQLLQGRTANVHRQKMRLRWESSSLLMAWAVAAGHYQQVKLALSAASLCLFSANKEALAYLAFVSSMGLCR